MRFLSLRGDAGAQAPVTEPILPRKTSSQTYVTVPQTDSGRRVEYTKAIGETLVKELGKIAP